MTAMETQTAAAAACSADETSLLHTKNVSYVAGNFATVKFNTKKNVVQ